MKLESRLPEIIAELLPAIEAAERAGAEVIAQAAKARVPVDSGRLRNAIHVETGPDGAYVVAGDREAFYGHIVEHGGVNHSPHPFLVPALEENRSPVEDQIRTALRRIVE